MRREFSPSVRGRALVQADYCCERCKEFHHIGCRLDRSLFNCQVLYRDCHAKLHTDRLQTLRWLPAAGMVRTASVGGMGPRVAGGPALLLLRRSSRLLQSLQL
jgi:hypothetical protein